MRRRLSFLDVFAERPLAGNGLAVVDEADGVSDEVMLAFANETRLSETTYVQTADGAVADYRNRIWTPGEELAFAGHPSLGTAVAVARWRGEEEASFVQQTGAGLQPVEATRAAGGYGERWRASMQQAETVFGAELDPDLAMACVGLAPEEAHPELPPQVVSTGIAHAIVPLARAEALGEVEPDYAAIDGLLHPHEAVCLYLAWCDPRGEAVRARSFARIAAVGEDPATGSAAGPLSAYLERRRGSGTVAISQGAEMGRPSTLSAEVDGKGRARVSGYVIPLIDGTVELPA